MVRALRFALVWWAWGVCVSACGGGGGGTSGPGETGVGIEGLLTGASSEASSGAGAGETGPRLDLPASGPAEAQTGCEKVDFLFVIDNSGSMLDEQANLVASFPGFIATIEETLTAKDYHILVTTTDRGEGGLDDCEEGACTCLPAPTCCVETCQRKSTETCNGRDCSLLLLDACLFEYGTGRVADEAGTGCGLADGRRWMRGDQPGLAQTFACAAGVGIHGSGDERPMQAALAAVGPAQNGPLGCDAGFLRDDAVLVLVFVTDEEDDNAGGGGSPGEPLEWYEGLVAAKHGDPSAVVVLGLVGDSNLPGGLCPSEEDPQQSGDNAEPAPRLQGFVEMFEHGTLGSVCAPDYTEFFASAVEVIDAACDDFTPVG